ncbi:aminodeoxychorismate synthase component I [Maribellus sp. CM-23]|uniref:aminodeoxychorismate synthase component I n=1 Tax=Maribellus sp. CM-23 TaxID=2781026 RepID=UPI001F319C87|nr:aminodeoxychorismate synthase component I [Maribellus sp. CM-23]MCE4564465.1 aminodeoxychorismate synthase component I [Maribellus sp. CM-23]
MDIREEIGQQMNALGSKGEAFVFLIDFEEKEAIILPPGDDSQLLWQAGQKANFTPKKPDSTIEKWETHPVSFEDYQKGFDRVQYHIHNGDTYLLNYTRPTSINCNLSLEEIFHLSSARYKLLLKDRFVCFSPETFVQIRQGKIASFPMKGTIDADCEDAQEELLKDSKELAEHNTIVDLIRNDLSLVAENVTVEKFRYLDRIKTSQRDLWQVSSKITGDLPVNYAQSIGDILFTLLPAGSISGAPKKKTVEIIRAAENYQRGFYTGIFGYFDGHNLDSCVLIRYIENENGQLVYKSGGGITFMSDAEKEYEELLKKVYVPIID